MNLLLSLLVFALIIAVVVYILRLIPIPEPIRTIVYLILGLIFLIQLLGMIGVGVPHYTVYRPLP